MKTICSCVAGLALRSFVLRFGRFNHEATEKLRFAEMKRVFRHFPAQENAMFGAAGHWRGRKGEKGRGAAFDKALKTIPGCGWDFAELARGIDRQVENHNGQISIAQNEVGDFDRFGGVVATEPEQVFERGVVESAGIK